MMNALRLNEGFSKELFESRTGLAFSTVENRVGELVARKLLLCDQRGIRATSLGRRFLDSVIAGFFPD